MPHFYCRCHLRFYRVQVVGLFFPPDCVVFYIKVFMRLQLPKRRSMGAVFHLTTTDP